MKIEPKEMSARGLDHLAAQADSTPGWHHGVKGLLAHIAHQDQRLAAAEQRVEALQRNWDFALKDRDAALARVAELEQQLEDAHRSNECAGCYLTRSIQGDRAEKAEARIDELTALLRERPERVATMNMAGTNPVGSNAWLRWSERADQALASDGAEKSKCVCHEHIRSDVAPFHCAVHGIVLPDVASVVAADTSPGASDSGLGPVTEAELDAARVVLSPGASERRTTGPTYWAATFPISRTCFTFPTLEEALSYKATYPDVVIEKVTTVRDVIAAGEKEGRRL